MQTVEQSYQISSLSETRSNPISLSWEWVAYLVLFVLIIFFWLSDIEIVPFNDVEATQALMSWHALENPSGDVALPDSPMLFNLHMFSYAFLGINEFAARLPGLVALMSLLSFSALYLRTIVGRERALVMSVLFAFSPFVFLSSRFAEPMLWALFFALIWLWSLHQHWYRRQPIYLYVASACFAFFFFLSAPGAPVAFMIIMLAAIMALYWLLFAASDEVQVPAEDLIGAIRLWLKSWQWMQLVTLVFAIVFLFATAFMVYPSGLTYVSQLLQKSLMPLGGESSPLLVLLTYDLLLLVLAICASLIAIYRTEFGYIERFATLWLILILLTSVVLNGFGSAFSLWALPPAIYLVSYLIMLCLAPMSDDTYSFVGFLDSDTYQQRYWWVKWAVAIVVASLVLMASFHWQEITRSLLLLPVDTSFTAMLGLIAESMFVQLRYSAIWFTISLLFLFVGFFLAASLWGNRNVWQGYGLGIVAFSILGSFGGGYNAAVVPERIAEIWVPSATQTDYVLLRQTLIEVAYRDTSGFFEIPVTIVTDDLDSIDPLLMWAVRDFSDVRYTTSIDDAAREQIVIVPETERPPDLAGSYVGQSFTLRVRWSLGQTSMMDTWPWLSQRMVRTQEYPEDRVILWLRQDVFEGVPLIERP